MLKLITLMILVSCFFLNCKTQDYSTPYEYPDQMIIFGNGGGFSGRVQEWTLLDNGQMFKGTNQEGNVNVLNKVDKDQVKQIFKNYKTLKFGDLQIDSPGNMYFFLIMKEEDKEHKLTWGSYDAGEPKELKLFYANLISLTRGQSNKSNQTKSKS